MLCHCHLLPPATVESIITLCALSGARLTRRAASQLDCNLHEKLSFESSSATNAQCDCKLYNWLPIKRGVKIAHYIGIFNEILIIYVPKGEFTLIRNEIMRSQVFRSVCVPRTLVPSASAPKNKPN